MFSLSNMLIPAILFFALGFVAQRVRSDLKFPSDLAKALSIYLLVAIGLHGGMELARIDPVDAIGVIVAAMGLGFGLPIVANAAPEERLSEIAQAHADSGYTVLDARGAGRRQQHPVHADRGGSQAGRGAGGYRKAHEARPPSDGVHHRHAGVAAREVQFLSGGANGVSASLITKLKQHSAILAVPGLGMSTEKVLAPARLAWQAALT